MVSRHNDSSKQTNQSTGNAPLKGILKMNSASLENSQQNNINNAQKNNNNNPNKEPELFEDELDMGNISSYNPRPKSCKEYAYEEERNRKYKPTMEDMHLITDKFNRDPRQGYFSLFDGHGGIEIVEHVRDKLPVYLSSYLKESNDVKKSLIKSFEKVDAELKSFKNSDSSGTTATVVLLVKETDVMLGVKRVLYCANVGDTRCVLLTASGCKRLSYDHKCSDETEALRIKKAGGNVVQDRIFGKLALSRCFGDLSMKNFGITASPTVNKVDITASDKYFIICSDGVWDVVSEEDIFYFSFQCDNTKEFAQNIIEKAIENGSTDNISCMVVKL